jgi:hypothetical protein
VAQVGFFSVSLLFFVVQVNGFVVYGHLGKVLLVWIGPTTQSPSVFRTIPILLIVLQTMQWPKFAFFAVSLLFSAVQVNGFVVSGHLVEGHLVQGGLVDTS